MDLLSARALLTACKRNAVQEVMLQLYKEEVKTFVRNSIFRSDLPEEPVLPANRCHMRRGGGRCRGAAIELSITQKCAYHQARKTSDLHMHFLRRLSVDDPNLYRREFAL